MVAMQMRSSLSPCAPFTAIRGHRMPRLQARRLVVKSQATSQEEADKLVKRLGKVCAPFAAAVLLFAQAPAPAYANPVTDTFENTLKRQQDLGSSKLDFNAFFGKGKKAAESAGESVKDAAKATADASDPSKAATQVPKEIPTFGKPIESSASASQVAQDLKNKVDPSKADTAAQKVKETVGAVDDKAPGEDQFRKTAKEGTKDNAGSGSNSNSQASAAPAYASKDEEKALEKVEQFQEKAERGDPDKPRLDPSIVEGEPEPGPAPGVSNKLPEQPKPEPGTTEQLGRDSAGGKVQETKRGSGPLDLFGGGPSGETPTSKAEGLIEKAEEPNQGNILDFIQKGLNPTATSSLPSSSNDVGSLAALEAPQPSEVDEKLPESAPGDENDLPAQPEPEPASPAELGKDSAGGKTDSTKSGGGVLDFFGGSSKNTSEAPQAQNGMRLVSNSNSNEGGFVFLLAAEPAPQPTELDEPEPQAAPGEPNTLPDQPRPESASYQTPQDSPGGKTEDTKKGSGPLDFFGGSDSGNSGKTAEKNIQKATSSQIGSGNSGEVALIAEEAAEGGPDEGKATIIGVLFSIALEIAIFSSYPMPEAHGKH